MGAVSVRLKTNALNHKPITNNIMKAFLPTAGLGTRLRSITDVCAEGEGQKIEFKAKTTALAKEFVAFANASGGSLFLGISDDGEIVAKTERSGLHSSLPANFCQE